jgi:hypothetical protein
MRRNPKTSHLQNDGRHMKPRFLQSYEELLCLLGVEHHLSRETSASCEYHKPQQQLPPDCIDASQVDFLQFLSLETSH